MKLFTQSKAHTSQNSFVLFISQYIQVKSTGDDLNNADKLLQHKNVFLNVSIVPGYVQNVIAIAGLILFSVKDVFLNFRVVPRYVRVILVNAMVVPRHAENVLAKFTVTQLQNTVTHLQTKNTFFYVSKNLIRNLVTHLQHLNTYLLLRNSPKYFIPTHFEHGEVHPVLSRVHSYTDGKLVQFLRRFIPVRFSVVPTRLT